MKAFIAPATLLSVCTLSGCTTLEIRPASNEKIQLEIINESQEMSTTYIYHDDYDCYGPINTRAPSDSSTSILKAHESNTQSSNKNKSTTISTERKPYQTVRHGLFAMIGLSTGINYYSCDATITFPTTGFNTFRIYTAGSALSRCGLVAYGVDNQTSEQHKIRLIQRKIKEPFFDTKGPHCAANEEMQGSSNLVKPRGIPKQQRN